jgi:hypothetical protein
MLAPFMDAVVARRLRKLGAVVALSFAIFVLPKIVWWVWPQRTLEVVIVDKTVPFEKYREHESLFWLLEAWKITTREGRFLDPTIDYVGFDPKTKQGTDLEEQHLRSADVLFVADTYGVYVGDYELPGDIAALERSPKIYGGLSEREAEQIEAFASRCGTVIAEFNTFASPTGKGARSRMESLFGASWTGWVARYWPNVRDPNEVPPWIARVYQRVFDKPFDVTGPAMIFVREDTDMVVLQPGLHLEEGRISTLRRTDAAPDLEGLPSEGEFYFWLDVVEAKDAEVLYEYEIDVNFAGAAELAAHGVPHRFPALLRKGRAYYFAGDMVDSAIELGDPERKGLLTFRRARAMLGGSFEERLMWGWYAPVMEKLIDGVEGCR